MSGGENTVVIELLYELILLINILNDLGFAHNDLKFNNVMFTLRGKMKLIDFETSDYFGLYPTKSMSRNFLFPVAYSAHDTSRFVVKQKIMIF